MSVKKIQYEEVLAECSDYRGTLALLKQYRPYLELIPSMRRPQESVLTIPLPLIRLRSSGQTSSAIDSMGSMIRLPADLAILMCDPEWKIKTGVEIFVFIHRPQEDFSDLLERWRQTQICLSQGYEWVMPKRQQHLFAEGADETHPLFVLFPETSERIRRGLRGTGLPFVVQTVYAIDDDDFLASPTSEAIEAED